LAAHPSIATFIRVAGAYDYRAIEQREQSEKSGQDCWAARGPPTAWNAARAVLRALIQHLCNHVSARLGRPPEHSEHQSLKNAYAFAKGSIDAIRKTDLGLLLWEV
jgi:hypothetical protein